MSFRVRPEDIRAYGLLLSKQTEYNEEAREYAKKHLDVATGEKSGGAIIPAQEYNIGAQESVLKAIDKASDFFDEAGQALRDTADYYEEVDEEEAAKLDKEIGKQYEWMDEGSIESEPSMGPTPAPTEKADPTDQLKAPKSDEVRNNQFDALTALNDSASLAKGGRELIKALTDSDPFADAAKFLVGDWEAFAKAGDACKKLAKFYEETKTNVDQYGQLTETWNGRAAFETLLALQLSAGTLHNPTENGGVCYSRQFEALYVEYRDLSQGVFTLAGAIEGLLNSILDGLIWMLAAAAGAGGTSWSGVGAAVSAGVAGGVAFRVISQVVDYSGKIGEVRSLVEGFAGMQAIDGTDGQQFSELKFFTYEHPGA